MGYNRPKHGRQSLGQKASLGARAAVGTTAVGAVAAGAVAFGGIPAAFAATPPLQVKLGVQVAGDGSSAVFNAAGNPVLTLGTGTATTGADVDITSAIGNPLPATEPTFTTNAFSTGSPRYWIELSNGASLMSNQSSSTVPGAPGSASWEVNLGKGWSNTLYTYANAVTAALQGGTGVTVKDAQVIADGDQAPGTADVITGLQYGGQVLGGGSVTLAAPADQVSVLGKAVTALKIAGSASSTVSDPAIAYQVSNLPKGLSFDAATGEITGTPTATGGRVVTVTATDAYGDTATQTFTWTVNEHARTVRPYVYGGHEITVSNNGAVVGWSEGPGVTCELVRIFGYGFSAADGSPHVGYTCDTGHPGMNEGFLRGLAAHHTYALQVVPATTSGRAGAQPLPGAVTGWIDVFTTW